MPLSSQELPLISKRMTSPIGSSSSTKAQTSPVLTDPKLPSEEATEENKVSAQPKEASTAQTSYNASGKMIQAARASKIAGRQINVQA
jgi:hypothetical protein